MTDISTDPFHEDAPAWAKVQTVLLMRIYDAQMAILANMNAEGEQASQFIHEQHQLGKIVGSLPWITTEPDED